MKHLTILAFLFLSTFLVAQEDPCGLYGPGTNGTVIDDCSNGPETYSSTCCSGNAGWFWTLGGNIDIFSSTSLPLSFSINSFGSTVTGTVVSASNSQIVIDWDCPETCPPSGYVIAELTACGSEWFNPTIRIGCEEDCEPSVQQCFLLDCGACIGVYINGQAVILNHTGNEAQLYCFDLGAVGCKTFNCGTGGSSNHGGLGANFEQENPATLMSDKAMESIPEVKVLDLSELEDLKVSPNLTRSYSQIEVSVPYSDLKTNLQMTDMNGNVIVDRVAKGGTNQIQLEDVASGLYVITIYNSDYTYTKKVIIQD